MNAHLILTCLLLAVLVSGQSPCLDTCRDTAVTATGCDKSAPKAQLDDCICANVSSYTGGIVAACGRCPDYTAFVQQVQVELENCTGADSKFPEIPDLPPSVRLPNSTRTNPNSTRNATAATPLPRNQNSAMGFNAHTVFGIFMAIFAGAAIAWV